LVGEEPQLAYQRPPLSKTFLTGEVVALDLPFASYEAYQDLAISIRQGRVVSLGADERAALLADGDRLQYDHIVLATGSSNRRLPGYDDIEGVHSLRTLADAHRLRDHIQRRGHLTIVGAGFLGLEVASVCAKAGISVRVLEMNKRIMQRNASKQVAEMFEDRLASQGVQFELGISSLEIDHDGARVLGVTTSNGSHATDAVLSCIGVTPNTALAGDAGLSIEGGVLVDKSLLTSAPFVSAIGDCATYPNRHFGRNMRLESVQNAVDQAKFVAARIMGTATTYDRLPWFWSEQAGMKLQIAGNTVAGSLDILKHGDMEGGRFSLFMFENDVLKGAESVGAPKDHMLVRKLLNSGALVSRRMLEASLVDEPVAA
jgi:3-phenylpropionate/trans-cinnamate dioxygenase ferredoxin reductase subunit